MKEMRATTKAARKGATRTCNTRNRRPRPPLQQRNIIRQITASDAMHASAIFMFATTTELINQAVCYNLLQ